MTPFEFASPTRIVFGPGRLAELGRLAAELGRRALVVSDPVKLEVKPPFDDQAPELLRKIATDLAEAHEGLRFNVEAVQHNTLPRFELKAKRLKDERPRR